MQNSFCICFTIPVFKHETFNLDQYVIACVEQIFTIYDLISHSSCFLSWKAELGRLCNMRAMHMYGRSSKEMVKHTVCAVCVPASI